MAAPSQAIRPYSRRSLAGLRLEVARESLAEAGGIDPRRLQAREGAPVLGDSGKGPVEFDVAQYVQGAASAGEEPAGAAPPPPDAIRRAGVLLTEEPSPGR